MSRLRKQLPAQTGEAELRFGGFDGRVEYEIRGEPAALRFGPGRLSGSFNATPEVAAAAFRAGEAQLRLDGGETYRITVVGHSDGSGVAYFELRV